MAKDKKLYGDRDARQKTTRSSLWVPRASRPGASLPAMRTPPGRSSCRSCARWGGGRGGGGYGFNDHPSSTTPDSGDRLHARACLPTAGEHVPPPPACAHGTLTTILDESKVSSLPATSPSPPGVTRLCLLLTPGKPQHSRATVASGRSEPRAGARMSSLCPFNVY